MTAFAGQKPGEATRSETRPASEKKSPATCAINIMSYNVLYGFRWPEARDLIAANPVDILCLQEVPAEFFPDSSTTGPRRILEDFDWPAAHTLLWGKGREQIGNMTLVRGEIEPTETLHAPPSEPYGILNRVHVNGASLQIANLHLTALKWPPPLTFAWTERARYREAVHVTNRCRDIREPVIALGDFNSFYPAPVCWTMRKSWKDCRKEMGGTHLSTRPTYGLPFVIDHIFVRGDVEILDYQVLSGSGSDHRAVKACLRMPVNSDS